jgi:hypothetical protein
MPSCHDSSKSDPEVIVEIFCGEHYRVKHGIFNGVIKNNTPPRFQNVNPLGKDEAFIELHVEFF